MEVIHGRGYVYSTQYHIVWCVKYRHKIIKNEIEQTLKRLLFEIAEDNEFQIVLMEANLDHVHLLISCSPQHYIPDIIKALKGVSARRMFKFHPDMKNKLWGGHLWNPSYFVSTVGETTEEQVKSYIESQKERS